MCLMQKNVKKKGGHGCGKMWDFKLSMPKNYSKIRTQIKTPTIWI
jgi:hypothetical protein